MGEPLTKGQARQWVNSWYEMIGDIEEHLEKMPDEALQHYEPTVKKIDHEIDDFRDMLEDLRRDYAVK